MTGSLRVSCWGCYGSVGGWPFSYRPFNLRIVRFIASIASSESNPFLVRVGLHQACPLSLVLFRIFLDRISRCSQEVDRVKFNGLRIPSLLFADDVVLLTSSKGISSSHWDSSQPSIKLQG